MIPEPQWVPEDVLHLLHRRQVELFGGPRGVRDHGSIASALYRPNFLWFYRAGDVDLADLAAHLLCGLARQQGFVDGNKRTAAAACVTFLDINGSPLHVSDRQFYWIAIAAAKQRMNEAEIAEWIRRRLDPVRALGLPPIEVRSRVLLMERAIDRLARLTGRRDS